MTLLDIILIVVLAAFVLYGFKNGLIQMLGSLVGLVLGVFLASRWYEPFSSWLASSFNWNPLVAKLVGFAILMALLNRAIGIAFWAVYKIFNILKIIPGVGSLNHLGGAIVGFVEGMLTIGIVVYVATKFNVSPAWTETLKGSALVPVFNGVAQIVVPLLPGALKSAQSVLTTPSIL
jgi:membrane protein required for colicin V production